MSLLEVLENENFRMSVTFTKSSTKMMRMGDLIEQEPRVKYCALISPGLERKGLRIAPTIIDFEERPLYIVASEQDVYSAGSCYLLSDVVDRVLEMDIFEGFMHGNALLNANTELQVKLINDLKRYLQP